MIELLKDHGIQKLTPRQVEKMTSREKTVVWDRGRRDLYFLCVAILLMDLTEDVHRPVCDMFVHKDPDKTWDRQDDVKDRLILDPREHYKTTIDCGDAIQWVIDFPDIRVKFWSGAEDLAMEIMNLCSRHFIYNDVFKLIYPEHAIDERKSRQFANSYEFITPARDVSFTARGATFTIATINSTTTGHHCEVSKYDDVVTPQNSETKEQIEKTIWRTKQTFPLIMQGGYRDFIGTTYENNDLYGWCQTQSRENPGEWKIHIRGASTLPLTPESVVLFTEDGKGQKKFDYKRLKKKERELGPELFYRQYYNRPDLGGDMDAFPLDRLKKSIIQRNLIPLYQIDPLSGQRFKTGRVFQTWDLAFSKRKTADFTVGVCGMYDKQARLYILDYVRGRWTPDEFVMEFFKFLQKWYGLVERVGAENVQASPMVGPSLRATATQFQLHFAIDWLKVERQSTKYERIYGLAPMLSNGKLFFAHDLPNLDLVFKEFNECKPKSSTHDDIPDAVQMLLRYQPMAETVVQQKVLSWKERMRKEQEMDRLTGNDKLGFGMVG